MRCEICGAPLAGNATRCAACEARGRGATVPSTAPSTEPSGEVPQEDSWSSLPRTEPKRDRLPLPSGAPPVRDFSSVVLEGKYRLLTEVGRGAMGTVFLAEDITLKRKVAVKFLLPELAHSEECADRFHREAVGMAAVRDNNVAQIYAFGTHGGTPYFVMEHLDGETVEDMIDAHNRRGFFVPLAIAIDVLIQAASGLAAIHRAGVVHRDIKPGNIMLSGDPMRAVIMDFGLVRTVRVEDETRSLAGTPAYMAPELVEGRPGADRSPLSDLYSFGAAAYELITGSLPFGGDTWVEILRKHLTEIPLFPSERRPGIPERLDEIVLRAMSKDPNERYQRCEELLDDLYEIEQMSLPEETRPSFPPGSRPQSQRRSSRKMGTNPPRALRSTPSGARGRLLVADADPDFRTLVHKAAKAAVPGCRIYSAPDGAMALKLYEEMRPNVVVVDLALPEVNGLELVATLRGEPEGADISIIVVAERGSSKEAEVLKLLKVQHFLNKPVDIDALCEILRPALERSFSLARGASTPPGRPV